MECRDLEANFTIGYFGYVSLELFFLAPKVNSTNFSKDISYTFFGLSLKWKGQAIIDCSSCGESTKIVRYSRSKSLFRSLILV